MKKILGVCAIIIVIVAVTDIFVRKKISNEFNYLIDTFYMVDREQNNEKKKDLIDEINSHINEKYLLMTFYIDSGELEKIKSQIVIIKAGIDEEDKSFVHEEIEHSIFIIDHLVRKIDFKLENIL